MVEAARSNKRVVQVGSQGRNHPGAAALRAFIQAGEIGDITRVECWHNDNPVGGDPARTGEPPEHLDWNLWLGPAAARAYNPDYCHRKFRWMLDLGGGQIRDRGAHVFSLVMWILGLDHTGPSRVTATGRPPVEGIWDCPTHFEVAYEFDDPKLSVTWSQPGVKAADFDFGAVYHGTSGRTVVRGGDGRTFPDEQVAAFAEARGEEVSLPRGGNALDQHYRDWFDCIRSREQPLMDIEPGHRVASMCILANLAYRAGRPLRWNAETERFIDDPAADHMLGNPGRAEFHL
jgi:predicted dehydrogenase